MIFTLFWESQETQFIRFAKEIFGKNTAIEGIEALESWFNKIGTPTRLNQFGLDKSNISDIIENLSYQTDIGKDDLEKILSNAL